MAIEFGYSADVGWLTDAEREALKKDLESCTRAQNWYVFDLTRKKLALAGTLSDEDDLEDYKSIEYYLDKYDLEWEGEVNEVEYEPDWDLMPGGYDYEYSMSLER